jgi:hypothetical protein
MAAGGYEIPISASVARTDTFNPILNAATTFNFDSPWASGGSNDQTSRITPSATATSSAALGGNAVSSAAPTTAVQDTGGGGFSLSSIPKAAWIGAGIAVAAFLYFKLKKG